VRRALAAVGSTLFLALAPGTVAGLIPWWLTAWRAHGPLPGWLPVRAFAVVLIIAGAAVVIDAFGRFVVQGVGTPAPVAPTERLVIGGPYRHVRNPMYLAVGATILGQALLLGRPVLLGYALAFAAAVGAFVHLYEQPTLRRRFGKQYEQYRASVPAWLPRLRPYRPTVDGPAPDDPPGQRARRRRSR
jgi:protein-S-isoprenylcysteine O-methyltransferase Ste14